MSIPAACPRRLSPARRRRAGISLAEILIVVLLTGLLATMSIQLVLRNPQDAYARLTEDYIRHLAAVYRKTELESGSPPSLASNGLAGILPTTESMVRYQSSSPPMLTYPDGMILYLNPEDTNISGDRGNNPTILSSTDNREWLLLDLNGTRSPNSLGSSGDRVLLYVENTTGRVLTAHQKCEELGVTTYTESFYDVFKGY